MNKKGNILLIVLAVAGLVAATVGGYFWWIRQNNLIVPPTTKEDCIQKGGFWSQNLAGIKFCQFEYRDAYKSCTDGSQCQSKSCLSFDGKVPGKCSKYQTNFGCQNYVENGKIARSLCVD